MKRWSSWLLAAALAVVPLWAAPALAEEDAAKVIVHPDVGQDDISRSLLRGIFGMRVRIWPDGQPVRVFVLEADHPLHAQFCRTQLRTYPYQLEQSWDRLVYSGTGQRPTRVPSIEAMRREVATTPGAIGYVPDDSAPEAAAHAARILDVR